MNESESSSVRCVGGIVHDAEDRLLLIRRGHAPHAGRWSIPGGRVEAGESDEQAVRRELLEETGLNVAVDSLVGSVHIGQYEVYDYHCRLTGHAGTTARPGDDAAETAWVDAEEFARLHADGRLTDDLAETATRWRVLPG